MSGSSRARGGGNTDGSVPAVRPDPAPTVAEVVPGAERPPPELVETAFGVLTAGRSLGRGQSDLMRSMLATLWDLAREGTGVGDLKIVDAALAEMTEAFRVFRPYRSVRKITMFGSARTLPEDPVYVMARDLAARLAQAGWMVVTGAGPGIMAAGTEGAGREQSFGVNIRLPHEQGANPFIAQDPKLVEMRYFFTRKLMLIKESHAYAVLPGGFGTQDECYELLTLLQTGKAEPAPVVLVETQGGTYWQGWDRFLREEAIGPGWVSREDVALFRVVDSVEEAAAEVLGFYRNYHSCRWVGDLLVLRLQVSPSRAELKDLSARFGDIITSGSIRSVEPLPPERSTSDVLELPRVAFRFDRLHYGRLRLLIDALNGCTGA
ncbi:MAG TPA: TIGR00730 family Rossman fold protein [Acidimicrobiales bacterium]|nr:TIGR00730 family Rossman fold protein [Acidimicrobiales bacterium]